MSTYEIVDATDRGRFELRRDGELLSHADYHVTPEAMVIDHVETELVHRDNGHAARLMEGIIEIGAARELRLVPICSYAVGYLRDRERQL